MKKEGKLIIGILILFNTKRWPPTRYMQNLKKLAQTRAEKFVTENWEKEKWTNKGTDKRYVADYLIYNATYHYQALYRI